MPYTTWLQGSFTAPSDCTIRATNIAAATSDWEISQGDSWASVDDMLGDWTAQLVSDFGAGWGVAVKHTGGATASDTVSITGGTHSIAWSYIGDGSAVRDWLGETADVSSRASGVPFTGHVPASWVPEYGMWDYSRTATGAPRAQMTRLDGSTQTQHARDAGEEDEARVTASFVFGEPDGAAPDYGPLERLEEFIGSVLGEQSGATGLFTVTHELPNGDEIAQVVRFPGDVIDIQPRRVQGARPGRVWRVDMALVRISGGL